MIKLGPGNDEAAKDALRAWPGPLWLCPYLVADHEGIKHSGGLQIGGGITDKNALSWIECGASKVSFVISNRISIITELRSGYRHFVFVSRTEVLSSKTADNIFSRGEGTSCRRHQVCLLACTTPRIWF